MNKLKKYLIRFVIFFVAIYALLCFLVYFFPQIFLYHPNKNMSDLQTARKNGYLASIIEYKADDGINLYAWYTKPTNKNKVIFFTHGNAGNLNNFYFKLIPFQYAGYATFLPEYRGYGGVRGKTSQKALLNDMQEGIKQLYKMGYKNEDIIVYGMSLGSHQATSVVHSMKKNGKFDALVLEVPFDNVPNTAKSLFFLPMPFNLLFNDKYDNLELIKFVETRVLVQLASKDRIINPKRGMNLYQTAVQPKDLIIYKGGGHNNLYKYENYKDIISWLEK